MLTTKTGEHGFMIAYGPIHGGGVERNDGQWEIFFGHQTSVGVRGQLFSSRAEAIDALKEKFRTFASDMTAAMGLVESK